jgi:hypothetical protein
MCVLRLNGWLTLSLSLSAASPNTIHAPAQPHQHEPRIELDPLHAQRPSLSLLPQLNLRSALSYSGHAGDTASTRHGQAAHATTMMPIRPYHSLLLLRDAPDVLALLPPDASPQLAQLVVAALPSRTFSALQVTYGHHLAAIHIEILNRCRATRAYPLRSCCVWPRIWCTGG